MGKKHIKICLKSIKTFLHVSFSFLSETSPMIQEINISNDWFTKTIDQSINLQYKLFSSLAHNHNSQDFLNCVKQPKYNMWMARNGHFDGEQLPGRLFVIWYRELNIVCRDLHSRHVQKYLFFREPHALLRIMCVLVQNTNITFEKHKFYILR